MWKDDDASDIDYNELLEEMQRKLKKQMSKESNKDMNQFDS